MMKPSFFSIVGLLFFSLSVLGQGEKVPKFVEGQLYVRVTPSVQEHLNAYSTHQDISDLDHIPALDHLIRQYNITNIDHPFRLSHPAVQNTFKFHFEAPQQVTQLISDLNDLPFIKYAERVPQFKTSGTALTPNDLDPRQWHLDTVDARTAWDKTTGSSNVKVAVLDNAIAIDHPDLTDNVWTNPGEIKGDSIDNDNNGYVDDINGWDAADGDNDPGPPSGFWISHGTHVAGIASATTDNNQGVASMGYNLSILPVKITSDDAFFPVTVSAPAEGIDYAISAEADVINMSWGGDTTQFPQTLKTFVNIADSLDIILIAAAGNNGDSSKVYPAAYPDVIAVGATEKQDSVASFSQFGSWLDLMAPGDSIWSTYSETSYDYQQGTSMASPLVAGLAGLMHYSYPTYSNDSIEHCLEEGCIDISSINPGFLGQMGAGRINADSALSCLPSASPPVAGFYSDKDTIQAYQSVHFYDTSQNGVTYRQWILEGGTPDTQYYQSPVITYNDTGEFDVTLRVNNIAGKDTLTKTKHIIVEPPPVPVAGFYSNKDSVLRTNTVQFYDTSANYPQTWAWSFPGGSPDTSNQQNPNIAYQDTGKFDVGLTVSNLAGQDQVMKNNYITVVSPPIAGFYAQPETVLVNNTVQFYDTSAYNPDSLSWQFAGGMPTTSSQDAPTVTYDSVGKFDVTMTAFNEHGNDQLTKNSYIVVQQDNAISQNQSSQPLNIYPVPAQNYLTLLTSQESGEVETIKLYNSEGKQVRTIHPPPHKRKYKIDLSTVSAGLYFIRVITTNNAYTRKVIINQ